MSDNHQHSHVVEESLQENKETKNEAMSMEEKPEEEPGLRHFSHINLIITASFYPILLFDFVIYR